MELYIPQIKTKLFGWEMSRFKQMNLIGNTDSGTEVKSIQALAGQFLLAMKMEEEVGPFVQALAEIPEQDLLEELCDDANKNAFWINVYNASNLHLMRSNPTISDTRKSRLGHFIKRQILVAGKRLSLVDIENGILRRSQTLWGLGYVPKPFPGGFERRHRVSNPDPRIHFALNCGAESCPPIRYYSPESIEAELDLATRSYLAHEVQVKGDRLRISALFNMYRGDFGGKRGAVEFIRKYRSDIPSKLAKLEFSSWDWTQNLKAFVH